MSSTMIFLPSRTEVLESTLTALVSRSSFLLANLTQHTGRTGRIGNMGLATSFFNSSRDEDLAAPLVKLMLETEQIIPDFLQPYLPEGFTADDAGVVTGDFASLKFDEGDESDDK